MEKAFLGIDVGSTAIKIGVIVQGESIYQNSDGLITYNDAGASYQKAGEILQVIDELLTDLPAAIRQKVGAIGFSVAMHSVMPVVDGHFDKVFLWSDQQATAVIAQLPEEVAERFYQQSGTPMHPMSTFAKILYFQKTGLYAQATHWWGLKELLMEYFTGKVVIDVATASATGMCNLVSGQWDEEILTFLQIKAEQLALIVAPEQSFDLKEDCLTKYGFVPETNVFCGGSDGCLAAYAGLVTTGLANSLTIGTSAALRSIGPKLKLDVERQNFCYRLTDELFVSGGPSNNGGSVLAWASQVFAEDGASFYRNLPRVLAETEIGAGGVKFYPFLNGERAPYWDAQLTGEFKHLTITTSRSQLIRSVLEGILLNIRTLKPAIIGEEALTLSGGFFETSELAQLTVDVLGNEAVLAKENEPIFGLYYLLMGQPSKKIIDQPKKRLYPQPIKRAEYAALHDSYFDDVKYQ